MQTTTSSPWRNLYKWGGVSAILGGLTFLVGIVIFFLAGPQFSGGSAVEATLKAIAANRTAYVFRQVVLPLGGFFFIPAIIALYAALKEPHPSSALVGAALVLVSLTIFLSLNTGQALLSLSDQYSAATTDAQRQVFVTAAQAVNELSSAQGAGGVLFAVGLILLGVAMLKSVFHKVLGYVGILSGIFILLAYAFGFLFVFFIVALAIWSIGAGYKLYKLG